MNDLYCHRWRRALWDPSSLWFRFFENKKVIIKEPSVPVISKPLKERTVLTKELAKIWQFFGWLFGFSSFSWEPWLYISTWFFEYFEKWWICECIPKLITSKYLSLVPKNCPTQVQTHLGRNTKYDGEKPPVKVIMNVNIHRSHKV